MIRPPAVAGTFYSAETENLKKQIANCFKNKFGPGLPSKKTSEKIFAGISPHAGYMYSGPFAAHLYKKIAESALKSHTYIILGPNHTGNGAPVSIIDNGAWATPLGEVQIDSELARKIVAKNNLPEVDEIAHLHEHSIEVQLPFLQFALGKNFKFVPICIMDQDILIAESIGKTLAEIAQKEHLKEKIAIIASSDFTHYEPEKVARPKDLDAIDAILKLDVKKFYSILEEKNVTACGFAPIAVAMTYAKELKLKAELLSIGSSGDITGDKASVVEYASIVFK